MNTSKKIVIILVILLAAFLRFYKLGTVPSSLNADEAAIGYNAYSVLKTGRDEFGEKLPLSFRSFDDYKAPLYIYLTAISISLFGLNNFAIRFVSAAAGMLTVVFTYSLVHCLVVAAKNKSYLKNANTKGNNDEFLIPLFAAFLLSVSPWHLQFSRSAYEANLSVFFIVLGIWFFYKGLVKRTYMLWAGIPFVLAMWSYHTPRVFVPLVVFSYALLYLKELIVLRREIILSLISVLVLIIPLIMVILSPHGLVRAKGISSLENPHILEQSVRWMSFDKDTLISRIVHNRRIEYAREIVRGYLVHFDPLYLFFDRSQAKYRAPGMGLMYLWELPFLLIGFYEVARYKQKWSIALFIWLMIAPVAASPTLWLPSPVRTIVMLPVLQIFTAFGLAKIISWLSANNRNTYIPGYTTICLVVFTGIIYYLHQYYVHLPIDYAVDWQFGRQEVVDLVSKQENDYDRIVVSTSLDQPQVFFLYYLRYDPAKYLAEGGTTSGKFDAQNNHFYKYYFTPVEKYIRLPLEKVLYVATPEEINFPIKTKSQIKYPDGSTAFVIYEK